MRAQEVQTNRAATAVVWLHDVREDGVVTYRVGRQGGALVAEWPRLGRLTCEQDGSGVRLTPSVGATPGALTKLRGVAKALVGERRGGLGIHASAVTLGSRAVLLLGESGAGKSTAAAELCLRHGARLLADDAALLEERGGVVQVVPSEGGHYLTEESREALGVRHRRAHLAGEKARTRALRAASKACPLALVVSLRFDDALGGIVCERLGGAEAARCVLGAMFRFDVDGRREELDRVGRVYQQAPFFGLARPHSEPSVVADILRTLGGLRERP